MASTLTTFSAFVKDRYTTKKVADLTQKSSPLFAKLKKDTSFSGDGFHVPLIYQNPQGIAGTLSAAQASANTAGGNVKGAKFILRAGDYNGSVSIGDKILKQSRNNEGAFLQNKAAEIDGLYESFSSEICTFIYGNSGNSIGRVSGAPVGLVVTLSEPTQIINFEVGMRLERNTVDGSDGTTAPTAETYTVTAVDRAGGTITLDNVTNLAATNFLFRKGSYRGNTGVFVFHGLQDFLWPDNSPPPIYSMTRTADTQRLAGSRVNAAELVGLGIEERLQLIAVKMTGVYHGPGPTDFFLNPEDWMNLMISLQGRGYRDLAIKDVATGFTAIRIIAGGVECSVWSDRFCPKGLAFALRLEDWTLYSMGELIQPIEEDGMQILRSATSNDYEYRLVSYPSFATNAPGNSGRVALA